MRLWSSARKPVRGFSFSGKAPKRCIWLLGLAFSAGTSRPGFSQASPAQVGGLEMVTLGGTFSASKVQYGNRLLLGAGAYVDVDYNQHYGVEAEGHWLWLHQREGVRESTYLAGPRYSFNGLGDDRKKFRPYAKFLIGIEQFRYPYGYASGEYFVLSPGGGVDYRISHRIRLRLVDLEYQRSPQFTYGSLSALGISSGLRFRLF